VDIGNRSLGVAGIEDGKLSFTVVSGNFVGTLFPHPT
jgi:hypothetical protein